MDGTMQVALLRGINVGGKNKVSMQALREIFAAAGCTEVTTYIQSGNVVFTAAKGVDVATVVKAEIAARLGLKVPVVLRTAAEIERAIAGNPFVKEGVDADWTHVMFLENEPTKEQVARLDAQRSVTDEFVVAGKDIYLHLPQGAAKTKLTTAYFDAKLKTVGTQRNWRTVMTLAEMMKGGEAKRSKATAHGVPQWPFQGKTL
jgi:uncharacterized protein (DUF1697 family)